MNTFLPGDLVFYTSRGRWYEQIITAATHGPYVHVAVVDKDGEHLIAALTRGITRIALPFGPGAIFTQTHTLAPAAKPEDAFLWLEQQVGKQYGFADIFDQGLRLLHSPVYLSRPNALDCSDLAACFAAMYTQDDKLMAQVMNARQLIAPNDLARYYGLLK